MNCSKPEGEESLPSDTAALITRYTKNVAMYLERLILQSLETLRKQYLMNKTGT